jgi:hypothetical protein
LKLRKDPSPRGEVDDDLTLEPAVFQGPLGGGCGRRYLHAYIQRIHSGVLVNCLMTVVIRVRSAAGVRSVNQTGPLTTTSEVRRRRWMRRKLATATSTSPS